MEHQKLWGEQMWSKLPKLLDQKTDMTRRCTSQLAAESDRMERILAGYQSELGQAFPCEDDHSDHMAVDDVESHAAASAPVAILNDVQSQSGIDSQAFASSTKDSDLKIYDATSCNEGF